VRTVRESVALGPDVEANAELELLLAHLRGRHDGVERIRISDFRSD
jgi:hypothetical protein